MAKDVVIGRHGHRILSLLYRYGALTQDQLCRLTGLHISTVKRQVGHLGRAGYVARALDVAGWKPADGPARMGYYLNVPRGAKAAAFYLGIENDYLALKHYRRGRLPATVSHRLLGNEYLLTVQEKAAGVEVPPDEVFSESWPGAPLFGTGTPKSDRENSPFRFSRIVPDGVFVLDGLRYHLEVETGSNTRRELVGKIGDYGGRWRRLLRPNSGERRYHDWDARLEPLVLLVPGAGSAKRLQKVLRERLAEAPEWVEAADAIGEVSGGRADPRQLVLVAGWDEVREAPLSRAYRPLRRYPESLSSEDGWKVSLRDAAAITDRIPVPKKPPKPEEELPKPEEEPLEDGEEVA